MSRSTLSGLSDRELLGRLKSLVEKERATTVEILLHLNEVERRRLYLGLGYPSLFEYCTAGLGYSSSAAGRRIAAARCVREYPEVQELLEKNEMTLGTVPRLFGVLTPENRGDLLRKVRGKSEREVEETLSGYRPPVALRDRVRPVCVAVPVPRLRLGSCVLSMGCATPSAGSSTAAGFDGAPPQSSTEIQRLRQAGTRASTSPPVQIEQRFQIQFLASKAFMTKLDKARALLSHRLQDKSFEKVFEAMIDEFLERHSPEKKQERRENRAAKRHEQNKPVRKQGDPPKTRRFSESANPHNPRHIPASVRDQVFKRDEGRCTYAGSTGKRCGSADHVQVDHIVPYARGGTNTVGNLRLLCGKHNRLEAERVYGENVIRRYRPRE